MNARHSDVIHMLHFVAHDLRGDDGFLGHRNIARSGRNHDDLSLTVMAVVLH